MPGQLRGKEWKSITLFSILLLMVLPLLIGCAATPHRWQDRVLAKVNEETVTLGEFEQSLSAHHVGHLAYLLGEKELSRSLDNYIFRRLLFQEANALSLKDNPDIIRQVKAYRSRLAYQTLIEELSTQVKAPTEEEIKWFYDLLSEEIRISHILVDTREQAETLRSEIIKNNNFEALARQYSVDGSAIYGGHIDFFLRGRYDQDFEAVSFSLAVSEISPVFKTRAGFHIVRLDERRKIPKPDYEKVQPMIKQLMKRHALNKVYSELLDQLLSQAQVKLHPENMTGENLKKQIEMTSEADNATTSDGSEVLASVDGRVITWENLWHQLDVYKVLRQSPRYAHHSIRLALDNPIEQILLENEALRRRYDERDEVISAVQEYENQLVIEKLKNDFIYTAIKVDDQMVERYYETHKEEFTLQKMVKVSHILLKKQEEAEAVMARIKAGTESFASLARSLSIDKASARRDGELGWIRPGETVPPFEEAAFSLPVGQVSSPIASSYGYHIIMVLAVKEEQLQAFSQVKALAFQKLLEEQKKEYLADWLQKLRERSKIKIYTKALSEYIKAKEQEHKAGEKLPVPIAPAEDQGSAETQSQTKDEHKEKPERPEEKNLQHSAGDGHGKDKPQ